MENKDIIVLEDCPVCRGAGYIMDEGGRNVQVECCDCSAHTVYVAYNNETERLDAQKTVARLWNMGKVIKSVAGE